MVRRTAANFIPWRKLSACEFAGKGELEACPTGGHVRKPVRKAFSILEVVLSLAILGGAVAVAGELARIGIENARIARDLTYAQLLCESKMAEIAAGIEASDPVQGVSFETTSERGDIDWLYSIESEPLDDVALIAVRVTVYKDLPPQSKPISFSMNRWLIDSESETTDLGTGDSLVSGL
jgi:hypothetical protein